MNLLIRMIWIWLCARKKPVLGNATEPSTIYLRVLPNDLDVFFHMNNSRYLSIMDLGRLDLTTRMSQTRLRTTHQWLPLVAASRMRYRKPLNLFDQYALQTRIVSWDEKWFYLEQIFLKDEQPIAIGWVKGIIRGPDGNIATADVLAELALPNEPAPASEEFTQWIALEQTRANDKTLNG